MNTKIISVGAGVLVILAVLLVGNMVVNTTPAGVANTNYEYKVVEIGEECADARGLAFYECQADILNQNANAGWEYVEGFKKDHALLRRAR
jgi:hypothetical protein